MMSSPSSHMNTPQHPSMKRRGRSRRPGPFNTLSTLRYRWGEPPQGLDAASVDYLCRGIARECHFRSRPTRRNPQFTGGWMVVCDLLRKVETVLRGQDEIAAPAALAAEMVNEISGEGKGEDVEIRHVEGEGLSDIPEEEEEEAKSSLTTVTEEDEDRSSFAAITEEKLQPVDQGSKELPRFLTEDYDGRVDGSGEKPEENEKGADTQQTGEFIVPLSELSKFVQKLEGYNALTGLILGLKACIADSDKQIEELSARIQELEKEDGREAGDGKAGDGRTPQQQAAPRKTTSLPVKRGSDIPRGSHGGRGQGRA